MSFQLTTEERFNIGWFNLVGDMNSSPTTGIKINIDGTQYYEAQSTFRFTDKAVTDATLTNLVVSRGTKESNYKQYQLTPTFNKEILDYQVEILEYIDDIDITATLSEQTATMKIKVPKRDSQNNLVYETDGITPQYEEKEIQNGVPINVILNKLGKEPDTIIEVIVTAEDGKTQKTYKVTIHRPSGTIKGSIQLGENIRESMLQQGVYTKYIADANIYKSNTFKWEGILDGTSTYEELEKIEKETTVITNEDTGEYEIYILPGTYDLQLERKGFLNNIVKNIIVNDGDTIEIGNKILYPGDVDRNGVVSLQDYTKVLNRQDVIETDAAYGQEYDFGQKGYISLIDLTTVLNCSDQILTIEEFKLGGKV